MPGTCAISCAVNPSLHGMESFLVEEFDFDCCSIHRARFVELLVEGLVNVEYGMGRLIRLCATIVLFDCFLS